MAKKNSYDADKLEKQLEREINKLLKQSLKASKSFVNYHAKQLHKEEIYASKWKARDIKDAIDKRVYESAINAPNKRLQTVGEYAEKVQARATEISSRKIAVKTAYKQELNLITYAKKAGFEAGVAPKYFSARTSTNYKDQRTKTLNSAFATATALLKEAAGEGKYKGKYKTEEMLNFAKKLAKGEFTATKDKKASDKIIEEYKKALNASRSPEKGETEDEEITT